MADIINITGEPAEPEAPLEDPASDLEHALNHALGLARCINLAAGDSEIQDYHSSALQRTAQCLEEHLKAGIAAFEAIQREHLRPDDDAA